MRRRRLLASATGLLLLGCARRPDTLDATPRAPIPPRTPTPARVRKNPPDTIAVGVAEPPRRIDAPPGLEETPAERLVADLLSGQLVGFDDRGMPFPDLAVEVPTLENGGARFIGEGDARQLVVTFRLRRTGWPDGRAFGAADVVAAWRRSLADPPSVKTEARYERVEAIDASTVTLTFFSERSARAAAAREPNRYGFLAGQRGPVLDPLYAHGLPSARVGPGPYTLAERRADGLRFSARTDYHRGVPKARTIQVTWGSPDALAEALRLGEIDLLGGDVLDGAAAARLIGVPGVRLHTARSRTTERLDLNLTHPALGDVRVRRAIGQTLDRRALAGTALGPHVAEMSARQGEPSGQIVYDPTRAGQALDEAGWMRRADGARERAGERLSLRLIHPADVRRATLAGMIQAQLSAVGIAVQLEPQPSDDLFAVPAGRLARRDFDMALYGVTGGLEPLVDLADLHSSTAVPGRANGFVGRNIAGWRDAEVDRILGEAGVTLERASRDRLLGEASGRAATELPGLVLFAYPRLMAASQALNGLRPPAGPTGEGWNVHEWAIESNA